ncbi:MAG: GNAT family N-acetyltransferase [Ignavibacteriae bacterium]|nr:GNAT family N-acetyltransferase [Ignavibacteriota bacterium]NOG98954.1 GNAT family N-acetyltransferase [Ignavibacteriota bacterium]
MKDNSILLRPARPEYKEGLIFARYADQAAEGFFRFMLGKKFKTIIANAFLEERHALSFENVMFAEKEERIVGMSSAFSGVQQRDFSDEPLRRAAKRSAIRMKLVRTIFAPMWRILESIPEEAFYIQSIAVESDLRGSGIGSLLMNDIEKRAVDSGSARLSLDVSAKNESAIKIYKHRQMLEISAWPKSRFLPTLFVRMSKDL